MIKDYNDFRNVTVYNIQNSGLDVGVVYFILKDILTEVEKTYISQVNKEIADEKKSKEKEKPVEENKEATANE